MYAHKITTVGAVALLLGCQLLVAALPASDYMWTRINTERYFASVEDCVNNEKDCLWPALSNRLIGSHEQLVPAVKDPAAAYPLDTRTLPAAAATATAVTDALATTSPCVQHVPHSTTTTTAVPDLWLELQRRDVALEDIPKSDHNSDHRGPIGLWPCFSGLGPLCLPGWTPYEIPSCVCFREPDATTKAG
ncbi:hypothetical protein A1O7_06817 [Cladophialophora yegresii CBS 114405]|uniref:Uncharacterized protein n=1 Tax=Cladophialophora yegresii CBS 114405 TaxID=1182544 RepID=W9VLT9_9EURO|nr:uncharacterized protein A1O7_06817 [Cladophialophora yegresii CBS 114405]EXJ56473.1 hypothetical protein A1O7_06817 [Cladophialophora yegresii CBS 114405]